MSCMCIEVDTCGFSPDEIETILDHLLDHHEKAVMTWIKEQILEGRIECKL